MDYIFCYSFNCVSDKSQLKINLYADREKTATKKGICNCRAYLLIEGKIFKHGTAQELANDEQVRRLYLGTNFELRRKDWIIDMERDNAFQKTQNTIVP